MIAGRDAGRLRVLVLGPLLGRSGKGVPTQAEQLSDALRARGCHVAEASSAGSAIGRAVGMAMMTVARARWADVVILMIYSGRSFLVQDVVSTIAWLLGAPLIMHLHGGALPQFYERFPIWSRRVLSRAAARVAPSQYLRKATDGLQLDSDVIPNMLPLDAYPFRCRDTVFPRLLWLRAFEPLYDPQLALHAFRLVKDRFEEATLVMAGPDHGLLSECRALASRLALGGSVAFPGLLDAAAKERAFASADVFMNTTRIDNAPVSVLEACAAGTPIVSTSVGGIPDLLSDEVNALLVPADAGALAAAIGRLVSEPRLSGRLSRNARGVAESSSLDSCSEKWLVLLRRVARKAVARDPSDESGSTLE